MDQICAAVRAHLEVELELSDVATAMTRNLGQLPDGLRNGPRAEGSEYMVLWRLSPEGAQGSGPSGRQSTSERPEC
jgi:hypothetical protein